MSGKLSACATSGYQALPLSAHREPGYEARYKHNYIYIQIVYMWLNDGGWSCIWRRKPKCIIEWQNANRVEGLYRGCMTFEYTFWNHVRWILRNSTVALAVCSFEWIHLTADPLDKSIHKVFTCFLCVDVIRLRTRCKFFFLAEGLKFFFLLSGRESSLVTQRFVIQDCPTLTTTYKLSFP